MLFKIKIFYLLVINFIIVFTGCKKDKHCNDPSNPECINYDPNYGIPSSDFTMRQSLRPFGWAERKEEIPEFSDTIVAAGAGVLFTAKEDNVIRYEWTIGDDNRLFTTKEVALNFSQFLNSPDSRWKPIPIQLKVVKVPKPPHNPADSVYVTNKNLVFADIVLWNGTFEGYFEHEPQVKRIVSYDFTKLSQFEVPENTFYPCPAPCIMEGFTFYGLLPKDTMSIADESIFSRGFPKLFSYKQIKWKADESAKNGWDNFISLSSGISYFHAFADYDNNNKIKVRIEYTHQTQKNGVETTYVFHGIKIN